MWNCNLIIAMISLHIFTQNIYLSHIALYRSSSTIVTLICNGKHFSLWKVFCKKWLSWVPLNIFFHFLIVAFRLVSWTIFTKRYPPKSHGWPCSPHPIWHSGDIIRVNVRCLPKCRCVSCWCYGSTCFFYFSKSENIA